MAGTTRRLMSLSLIGLVLLAAWLRWPAFFANTFHADEALFASWARLIAVWRDPLLQSQVVDKPPLLFYTQAIFFPLFGPVEWAARVPNFIAGVLLVPLTGRLAWSLYRGPAIVLLAAAIVALSPLAIQFSPTAFTDPLLTCLLLAAMVATVSRRPGQSSAVSGLLFGLAVATKYQAWLFLPLLLALAIWRGWPRAAWGRFLAGLAPVLLALLAWEVVRSGRPALWSNQLTAFGGLRSIWSWELWPRLMAWGRQWHYLLVQPWAALLLLALVPFFWIRAIRKSMASNSPSAAADQIILLFLLAYMLLHWLLAIPVWDRYLLPLLPLVAVLAARLLVWPADGLSAQVGQGWIFRPNRLAWGLLLVVFFMMAGPAAQARAGEFPVGGRPDADGGASQVAGWLSDAPYGTVLYDHWHSWHWRYYFFDQAVYVSWFPYPAHLVADLQAFAGRPETRYLALPAQPASQVVVREVTTAGFDLVPVMTAERPDGWPAMYLYRLEMIDEGG